MFKMLFQCVVRRLFGYEVFWPTVSLFPVPRKRNDSSDTRVAIVTLLDRPALVLLVMHAWPRRLPRGRLVATFRVAR